MYWNNQTFGWSSIIRMSPTRTSFNSKSMIQKLEDLAKQLAILPMRAMYNYQSHIHDKNNTTSHKPNELRIGENQEKFQSSLSKSLKPTLLSTDKMIKKIQPKKPQSRENEKKHQFSKPRSQIPAKTSSDKIKIKIQLKKHRSIGNNKNFQTFILQ